MSKQSEAKARQGYEPKPRLKICSECEHFTSDKIKGKYGGVFEKYLRCGIGGFATKKTASCEREHKFREARNA